MFGRGGGLWFSDVEVMLPMDTVAAISGFFVACEARRRSFWGDDPSRLTPSELSIYRAEAIRAPGLPRAEVLAVVDGRGFPTQGLDAYLAFLGARSYQSLDCDGWIEFLPSESLAVWQRACSRLATGLDGARLLPIGYDAESGAAFCLHAGAGGREPCVSLVTPGETIVGVFSSVAALLRVLAAAIASETVLLLPPGEAPTPGQRELVARLRALDREGFGRVGWPRWYRRFVGGSWIE